MRKLAIVIVLGLLSLLIGVAVGFGVLDLVNMLLPLSPGEDLASHESLPMILAAAAGIATAIAALTLGWERYGDLA